MDIKDQAAVEFGKAIDKMRIEVLKRFEQFKDLPQDQLLFLISSDMRNYAMNTIGFKGDIEGLMGRYEDLLSGTDMIQPLSSMTLQAFHNFETAKWLDKSKIELGALEKELFTASSNGIWNKSKIIKRLESGVHGALTPKQINTEVTTAMSTYNRSIGYSMMNKMPAETKYVYTGPLDGKTRDYGLELMGYGALTLAEIESTAPESLTDGCGFNCRGHHWALITEETKSLKQDAKVQRNVNKLKEDNKIKAKASAKTAVTNKIKADKQALSDLKKQNAQSAKELESLQKKNLASAQALKKAGVKVPTKPIALNVNQQRYVKQYTRGGHSMNKHLRGGKPDEIVGSGAYRKKVSVKTIARDLNKTLDQLPDHSGTVYRGTGRHLKKDWNADVRRLKPGKVITDKGFLSTSTKKSAADQFARHREHGIFYTIKSKTGKGVKKWSSYKHEEEILFKAGSRFKVISSKTTIDGTHNLLEVTLEQIS